MRNDVNQAKIHIVKKLTRDAQKLRQKKGTDIQKAKNQRKADKLGAEILSIKKIKKDDITKYVLTTTINFKETLEDQNSTPLTRIMARIANHKKFSTKISEFKNKYPNYIEFLGPGRKKKAKFERKEKAKLKKNKQDADDSEVKEEKENNVDGNTLEESDSNCSDAESEENKSEIQSNEEILNSNEDDDEDGNEDKDEDKVEDEHEHEDKEENEEEDKNEHKNSSQENLVKSKKMSKSLKIKPTSNKPPKAKVKKDKKIENNDFKTSQSKKKSDTSKVISKQAIVKKFTDILEEEDSNSNEDQEHKNESTECNIIIEKEEDPFFVTEDGFTNYLSVVLPKSKNFEEDDYDDNHRNNYNKRKFSHQENDRFFSKVPKFSKDNSSFNRNGADQNWSHQQRNEKPYDRERRGNKPDFNKFSNDRNDRGQFNKKHAKTNFEQQSDEILHPSWEAKKKEQEILKKGFQGKKIVFGDDA